MEREILEVEAYGKELSAIYRHLQMLISERLAPLRIGSGQHIFLMMITKNGGISQKELSRALLMDKTTTAKAVKKLEAEGYVRRETDSDDHRYQRLYVTEAGKKVVPKVEQVLLEVMKISLVGIELEEYKQLMRLLKMILHNLSIEVRKPSESE